MQIVEETPTSCLFKRERRCPPARQPHAHLCLGLPGPVSPAARIHMAIKIMQPDLALERFQELQASLMHPLVKSCPRRCTGVLLSSVAVTEIFHTGCQDCACSRSWGRLAPGKGCCMLVPGTIWSGCGGR